MASQPSFKMSTWRNTGQVWIWGKHLQRGFPTQYQHHPEACKPDSRAPPPSRDSDSGQEFAFPGSSQGMLILLVWEVYFKNHWSSEVLLSQWVYFTRMLSHSVVSDSATPWTLARQDPLSMGFSRQEYWSGLPCPLPGDLPDPGIEPESLMSPALAGGVFTTSNIWEAL